MNLQKYAILLLSLILLIALICTNKAKAQYESMQTFFNSKLLGMKIEVDATAKTQPNANITFVVSLTPEADITIKIKSFNFTVYGFINGTDKVKLYTNMSNDFELTNIKHYNGSFHIPENICGITQGEIYLTYNVTMKDPLGGTHSYPISDITLSFAMTYVEDVYRKLLEEQLKNITIALQGLNQTYLQLNETYWNLKRDYEELSQVKNELDTARTTMAVLVVVTVIFVITTIYLMIRRPKTYW